MVRDFCDQIVLQIVWKLGGATFLASVCGDGVTYMALECVDGATYVIGPCEWRVSFGIGLCGWCNSFGMCTLRFTWHRIVRIVQRARGESREIFLQSDLLLFCIARILLFIGLIIRIGS